MYNEANSDFCYNVWGQEYDLSPTLRFVPQTAGGAFVGVSDPVRPDSGREVYIKDQDIDDLITVLSYYKQLKLKHGSWQGPRAENFGSEKISIRE